MSDSFEKWLEQACGASTDDEKLAFVEMAIKKEGELIKARGYKIRSSPLEKVKERIMSRIVEKMLLEDKNEEDAETKERLRKIHCEPLYKESDG